jgi:hypothetical protein
MGGKVLIRRMAARVTAAASCAVVVLCLFDVAARADQFAKVRCGSDIPKALVGQRASNERVVALEGRHKDLGLKDLGADEISRQLSTISWMICGSEFMLLEDQHVVRDVIAFPPHSKSAPAFGGICQIDGKDSQNVIVAVLNDRPGMEPLPATAAWKIDEKRAKFVKISTDSLFCPRNGIRTSDGGL